MSKIASSVVKMIISHFLDSYINPVQVLELNIGITEGSAELNNVTIKPTALSTHHLPFTVTNGIIQSIKFQIPWLSLKKKPCIIEIDGVHIIANFTKTIKLKSELEIKESVLKDLEEAGLGDEQIQSALFQGLSSVVISNIIVNIKNIHVRIEINTPDPNTSYAIGLMCNQIECFTINEKGEQSFVKPEANISKRIKIHEFSIYADPQPELLDLPTTEGKVEDYLRMRYKENHEYILDSFSFISDYIITKEQLKTYSKMDNLIDQICFKLTQNQMSVFGEFLFQFNLFQLRQKYSLCGRPHQPPNDEDEIEEKKTSIKWWRFLHQCTIEKRYPNRIKIPESLHILKNRNQYYQLWGIKQSMPAKDFKKGMKYKELKKVEDKLPLNSILFLRNYSEYRINKEKKEKLVVDQNDLDLLSNAKTYESNIDISLLIKRIIFNIYQSQKDANPILTFDANELNSKFNKSFDKSMTFSLNCKEMKIYSKDKIIFHQDSKNRSSVEFNYKNNPITKEEFVDIIASTPFVNVDLKFLYRLKVMLYDNGFNKCPSSSYFSFSKKIAEIMTEESNTYTPYMIRKGQYADMILQKKCDEYPFMKIKMQLLAPRVHIQGAKLSFKMKEINLESFPIHGRVADKVETLYSNYLIKCTDFTIGLGEYEILKPVTIDINLGLVIFPVEWLDKFRISLNVSSIAVVFNKDTYSEIVDSVTKLLKLSHEYEQTETRKALSSQTPEKSLETIMDVKSQLENVNVEKLSTNFATKVSIVFNNISLELVTVGKFDIVNFETQITIGSNGLELDLRVQNIICNSLENKYIFFNINETESDNHFLKENNAIVCQYTLFFDKAVKMNMSINSPTIIIDFGWIESTLDFFKNADIKSLMHMYQPPQEIKDEINAKIIETVMTSTIEFQLLKPTFKVILPALNKFKDDVELTLNIDYISYGGIESETKGKQNMLLKMPTFSFEWKKRLEATINNFSILMGDSISLFFDHLTIFDIIENKKNIEIIPLLKQDNPLYKPFLQMRIDEDEIDTTINDFNILFDVNSYMIPELILSLLKSSVIAKIVSSFIDETEIAAPKVEEKSDEKQNSSKYNISLPNVNAILIDNDVKLNSHFNAIFTISSDVNHIFFKELSLSFSEKEFNFAPIFENITLEFGIRKDVLFFSLSDTKAFISPSDIIDIKNFVNKVMNLYTNFSYQLDYSRPIEETNKDLTNSESNKIQNICLSYGNTVLEFCEDNRTTKIPFPFIRLLIKANSTKVSLKKAPSFSLLGFQIDIFNKNTQRWDLLIEPLEIYLSYTDTKNYNLEIKKNMNVVLSHSILNQICQFQFERQSIDQNKILPSFLVENNTHDMCEFEYDNKDDNMLIPPQCLSALKKIRPFKFMETVIDPLNFYSPQFISNKYSLSIFIKGKERHISINSPLLLKNKSDVHLIYQERHSGKVIQLYKKSITPLFKLTAEFAIYGKDPTRTPNTINLFKLKEKKQLVIPVYVGDKTYHFYLSIKFSKKRGIVMLKIAPKFIIRNNHIHPIDFTVNETQEISIPPKSTEYMNQIDFDSSFSFYFIVGNYASHTTKLNLNKSTHMAVILGTDTTFSLRYDKEIDKGIYKEIITLQPPVIIKNQTNLPVTIFDYQNEPILTLKEKNSEDFIGTRDFFKDNKVQISFQIEGYEKSELFDTVVGRRKMYLKSLTSDLYIPVALLISIGATGIIYIKIDHLIYVRNESIEILHFQPDVKTNNDSLDINPSQTKPVLLGTSDLNFIFKLENKRDIKIPINLQNTFENRNKFATLFINQYDMKIENQCILSFDFQTSSTLAGYIIEIKNCVFPQPLVLTNLLGEKNEIQKGEIVVNYGFNSKKIVKPMSTSIISSRDLVGQKLTISCYNKEIEVNLAKFTEPTENIFTMGDIKLTVYTKLVCLENGSHLIIVSNEIENKPNKFNLFSTHEISFGLSIPFISLNLIDDQMKELSLIGLQNTSIKCQFTKDTVEFDLNIDLFQIDDMYPDTIVPVAVFNSSPPFISLKMIKENANMIFDLIELKMKPLTFYIDINFIAELFNFFTTIKMKEKDESIEVKATSNHSSIPILIKKLYIDKIDIHASASSQTDRPKFHPFPYDFIIDVIPSVASIHIDRKQFTKTDLTSDNKVLNKMLKDYYNPLISELKGLVAAHSISFAFVGLSNAIHKMNNSTKIDVAFNQEKGKVVQRGFQQFGKGLLNGVTGIIMKPIKGAKKDGAKGFFIGLGKGVGGIVTDPLAGIIDASNGIVGEIKNSLSESRDSMRFPRVFNNIQIQEYDDISAVCQLQYQRHSKNYNDGFVFFVKSNDKFIGITDSFIAVLVPNTKSKKPSKKYKVDKIKPISEVESANTFNNCLIIKFDDEYVIDIDCESNEIADIATKIIISRSYYNNYSSNASNMTKMASTDFSTESSEVQENNETKQVCIINDGFYSFKNSKGNFVTNDKEYFPLVANRKSAKGWEKFKIINNDDGTISFLSCKNNKYVSVGSKSKLFANAVKIGMNEKFSVTKVDDNHFNFISMKTRQYVSADRNHSAHLYANRTEAKGWEKFELVPR